MALKLPRGRVDPSKVVVDAAVRLAPDEVLKHFKVKAPPIPPKAFGVLVMDYGFAKMFYTRTQGIHFMCALNDWPQLIEGLEAYLKECKIPRINSMLLATVVFTASEYCDEFEAMAYANGLEGGQWDVYANHFGSFSL